MQLILMPIALQEDIIIDFIIKFLKLRDPITNIQFNFILVIINKFTKYALIILFYKNYLAKQLGYIILDKLV